MSTEKIDEYPINSEVFMIKKLAGLKDLQYLVHIKAAYYHNEADTETIDQQ